MVVSAVFLLIFTLQDCYIVELLWNKVFFTRKNERKVLIFGYQAVSNSGNATASISNANGIGSTQKYLVSL